MGMNTSDSDGLGLSLLVYMGAILGAFAVLAAPVYIATKPQVYENPQLARANPLLNGPIVGVRQAGRMPVASLQRQAISDAESAKWLTARNRKVEPAPRAAQRVAQRPSAASEEPVPTELQTRRRTRIAIFPFSLF